MNGGGGAGGGEGLGGGAGGGLHCCAPTISTNSASKYMMPHLTVLFALKGSCDGQEVVVRL